ncbi:unnamed protein product, partial [Discosporangium mesarthrocarpum]
ASKRGQSGAEVRGGGPAVPAPNPAPGPPPAPAPTLKPSGRSSLLGSSASMGARMATGMDSIGPGAGATPAVLGPSGGSGQGGHGAGKDADDLPGLSRRKRVCVQQLGTRLVPGSGGAGGEVGLSAETHRQDKDKGWLRGADGGVDLGGRFGSGAGVGGHKVEESARAGAPPAAAQGGGRRRHTRSRSREGDLGAPEPSEASAKALELQAEEEKRRIAEEKEKAHTKAQDYMRRKREAYLHQQKREATEKAEKAEELRKKLEDLERARKQAIQSAKPRGRATGPHGA